MKPRKPDRFERVVFERSIPETHSIKIKDAENLLRNEHAWIKRMVKREAQRALDDMPFMGDGDVIENILARLRQRRK